MNNSIPYLKGTHVRALAGHVGRGGWGGVAAMLVKTTRHVIRASYARKQGQLAVVYFDLWVRDSYFGLQGVFEVLM